MVYGIGNMSKFKEIVLSGEKLLVYVGKCVCKGCVLELCIKVMGLCL